MSGLVTFFKDSFPEVHNIDYSRSLDDVRDHEIGNDNLEDYYYFEEEGGGQLEYTPQDWNIKEWRDFNKESLKVYFSKRIAVVAAKRKSSGQDDDDDDDDDDDEEYDDDDEEYEDTYSACANSEEDVDDNSEGKDKDLDAMETQEEKHQDNHNHNHNWETQQPQPVKPAAAAAAASKKQPRRRRIPHLHQAIHVVHNKLEYLDLYTQEISCHLCKVTKIWNIRETKRGIQNPGTYKSPVFPGRMPRFPFQSRQEDGPLACVFKYVMSMEIEPIINYTSAPPPPPPATVASGASSSCASSSPKRLRIFFYNAYAKALSEWLDAQTSTTNFLMRLDHIPAVSIMPFANDPRNWFDQEELIEYCLCIGDRSSLKIQNNSTTTPLRLDSETLQVRVAVATHSNVEAPGRQRRNRSEMILSRHVLQEEEDDDEEMFDYNYYGVSSLQQAWNEYRQQQLEEERIQKQHQFQQQRWLRQPPQGKKTFPPAPAKEYAEITRTSQGKTTEHQEISSTVAEASELGERPVQQQRQQQQPMQVDTTSAQQPMETEQNMTTTATTLTNNGQRQPIEMDPALATLANFANLREPSSSPAGCLLFEGQAQRRQEPSSPTSQGKEYIYTPLVRTIGMEQISRVARPLLSLLLYNRRWQLLRRSCFSSHMSRFFLPFSSS